MLIVGGTVVDVDGSRRAELRIGADGRIADVRPPLAPGQDPGAGPREILYDATDCLVVPGGIDAHTHFRLPVGHVRVSDDFESGTRAGAVGGTTTVIDYVTAYRGHDPMAALATWKAWAEPAAIDVGLHMTFTEAVPEGVMARCIDAGVTSFKLYMAYPRLLQVDDGSPNDEHLGSLAQCCDKNDAGRGGEP